MNMNHDAFVLDCSVTMTWIFADEASPKTNAIKKQLLTKKVKVPPVWPLEVANVLYLAQNKGRISEAQRQHFIYLLTSLPIEVNKKSHNRIFSQIIYLAQEQQITVYDASYLDLAMYEGIPLATLDKSLQKAAKNIGVELI